MVVDVGYLKKVTKRLLTLIITIIGIYFAFKMAVFYMPFLIAFIISVIVEPIITKVHKKNKFYKKSKCDNCFNSCIYNDYRTIDMGNSNTFR